MAEPQAVYRIVRWAELYELPKREQGGDGPLKYVRAWVHGHSVDEAYRLLFSIAPDVAAAAYGLFSRLRDIAADEPRKHRDGTIRYRQHRPATVPDIAFMTLFPADLVGRCLELLCHPDIQWIERVTAADATDAEQPPTHDATATRRRRDGRGTGSVDSYRKRRRRQEWRRRQRRRQRRRRKHHDARRRNTVVETGPNARRSCS